MAEGFVVALNMHDLNFTVAEWMICFLEVYLALIHSFHHSKHSLDVNQIKNLLFLAGTTKNLKFLEDVKEMFGSDDEVVVVGWLEDLHLLYA